MHGERSRRCGGQGAQGKVKRNHDGRAKEFDLCSVDTEILWEILRTGVMETKQCFGKIVLLTVKGLWGESIARSVFSLALAS